MNVFIISYNRLTPLQKMCEWIVKTGHKPIIIDNNSSYEPLVEWLKETEHEVIFMIDNYGHQVYFNHLMHSYTDRYYCVTDPDLDLSDIPDDWADVLLRGLNENPDVIKSGFSLRINDLPVNAYTNEVIEWESKFYNYRRNDFYLADIDTTFAMYDRERDFGALPNNRFFSAVRSPEPYTAKHIAWYNTPDNLSEEEKYYMGISHGYWTEKFKQLQ